jgi:hypothetical protein
VRTFGKEKGGNSGARLCTRYGINDIGQLKEAQKVAEGNLISKMYWVLHTEVALDRPLSEVWPVFKDIKRWYTEYTVEDVSGPSYQSGSGLAEDQVLKVIPKDLKSFPRASNSADAAGPQYFIQKTIKVVPQKEIVILLSEPSFDYKRRTQFYVWKMSGNAKKTTIFIDAYGEAELAKPLPKGDFLDYYDKRTRNFQRSWSEAFATLRKVLHAKK